MHHNSRSKIWAIGIFSLLIICTTGVGLMRLSRTRSALIEPNADALKAYALGDWATSARLANARLRSNQEDVEAVRILARSSARQGRDDLATTLYENRLGLQSMQSEDHFLLGRMIATQGNTDLALGVWEKALKEDSSHPEMLESFAGMSAQKSHLEEAVAAASKLAAIPGLKAKGLLMQGIFKSLMEDYQGSTKSISQAFLIDPKIKSSFMTDDQQMRLFLKDLLRNGQPAEARKQIDRFYGNSVASDPEISWLMSRIEIQEGQANPKSDWSKKGLEYRQSNPMVLEPAGYVGSARCVKCHKEISESYQHTRHASSFHHGQSLTQLPMPNVPLKDPDDMSVNHTFEQKNGRVEIVTKREDQEILRVLVDYAFGTKDRYVTMVGRDTNNTYRAAKLSHFKNSTGEGWDRSSGDTGAADPDHGVMGQDIHTRDGVIRCLACHVTTPRDFRFNRPDDEKQTAAAADSGIGCEKCHGPGENHVTAIKFGLADLAIRSLSGLSGENLNKACVDCHTVGDPREVAATPEDPKWVRSAGVTFSQSKCFTESQGQLSCLTCHSPHQPSSNLASFYESKCLTCHSSEKALNSDIQFKVVACKTNATKDCLNCHMPKVPVPVLHNSLTDHYIRIRKAP